MKAFAWLLIVASCVLAPAALATPKNKAALARHYGPFLARNLNSCSTCHLPSEAKDPQSLEEFPHNPFGARLRERGKELAAAGKARDIGARVTAVADEDADGDGANNAVELLLGRNPGDGSDKPLTAELETLEARQKAFATFLSTYRWIPFEPVKRPDVPKVKNDIWVRNPIDAFLAAEHEARGLTPRPEAPRGVLLRRLYIDLIGLLPTPAEIDAFERDESPGAYEALVDRLLDDKRHGERWGRHWMDVWRYSDWAGWTDGGQIRDSQPHIWRWRDWIVESLNADKPYDQMLVEMLAADELWPEDADKLRATGFLARNYKKLSREQWLEDTVNHTSRALLGVTLHCAKCHDHMYDPLSQEEYYRFRAIFEPHDVRVDRVPGVADPKKDGLPRAYDKDLKAETFYFIRGDERRPDKDRGAMPPGVPKVLGVMADPQPVKLPFATAHPDRREFVRNDLLADARKTLDAARKKHDVVRGDAKATSRQKTEAESAWAAAEAKHRALEAVLAAERLEDAGRKASDEWKALARDAWRAQRNAAVAEASYNLIAYQYARDDMQAKLDAARKASDKAAEEKATKELTAAAAKLEPAQKALAKAAAELNEPVGTGFKSRSTDDYPESSTGRRAAFARWAADRNNPLTARVAVNHIWARHFGSGLVPSVDDFGGNGRAPTNAKLLDWLAAELMDRGWSMKAIHRLIVTSTAYRMASTPNDSNARIDPDNLHLWRMPSRRMEAEAVRDNILWAAGQLDLATGGPEIDHKLGLTSRRRSIYLRTAPEKQVEFLAIFDGPSPTECYERKRSVMPQQALALSNSPVAIEMAKALAASLTRDAGDDADRFLASAFMRILSRPPAADELSACREFLRERPGPRSRENLVLVLFNHNDFVTIR